MNNSDYIKEKQQEQLQLWIYYLPVVGLLPSIWTLKTHQGSPQQQAASRLAISLALIWLLTYILLFVGASQASELTALRLLYTNALLTTSYFLVCLGLMFRLKQAKSTRLPLISKMADTIIERDQ
jgi:hypothetical protein